MSECHELGDEPSTQFVLHRANDLLVNFHGEKMNPAVAVAIRVKPSLNVVGNVFVEIVRSKPESRCLCNTTKDSCHSLASCSHNGIDT